MQDSRVTNALPRLPGYTFEALSQPVTYNKRQVFGFRGGVREVKDSAPREASSASLDALSALPPAGFTEQQMLAAHPQWKTLADKVLRYFGYFTEPVFESPVEKQRVRKVSICLFLSDGAVAVSETPATANSGLKPGTLMSRHIEPGINATTLLVGSSVSMRGRTFHIVDCDAATRLFCDTMGIGQEEPMEYPPDQFEALVAKPKKTVDADHIQMKRNVEMQAAALSGHQASFLTPEERISARNFLDHDREVLKFFAVWDQRKFRVQYYIADGTLSVTSELPPNSGRDPNTSFIRRSKVPKGTLVQKTVDTISLPRSAEPEYVADTDLVPGSVVRLFERDFLIYDCDPYTKEYFLNQYGVELQAYEAPPSEGDRLSHFRPMTMPPSTGYGGDDDSAQSFRSLVMKAPKKDFAKYFRHISDVLRFTAHFKNPSPENTGRQFILCYYLSDDSVSVYEQPTRNSGHIGGKIFSRTKVPSIKADSCYVGAEVQLAGQVYVLSVMDERTEKFLQTGVSMGSTGFACEELLLRIRNALHQRYVRVTEAYRRFSTGPSGLSVNDLRNLLKDCEIRASQEELLQLMTAVDRDNDGVISLSEFIEHVMGQPVIGNAAATTFANDSRNMGKSASEVQSEREKAIFADRILKLFITKLEARRAFVVDTFRIVSDRSVDGLINVETFKTVVQERLGLQLTAEELDALVYKFFYVPGVNNYLSRRLTLREFRRIIEQ